ncbi:transporter [Longibacter salinarum]|uniref:Transporter n=1 Tax=Longibacter salinarum TaxID=1850348 RepID=A0A2A8CWR7_9BACT|nr:outer membrane protein transport protein [Longibacter salinarum]PEN13179.1 transporter [Longibacter salinarum]
MKTDTQYSDDSGSCRSQWFWCTSLTLVLLLFAVADVAPAVGQVRDRGLINARTDVPDADDIFRFSERLPGVTARSIGRAGAGVAGTGDASALYTNPAGLGWASSSQAGGGFSILTAQTNAAYQPPGSGSGFDLEASTPNTTLSNFDAVYKVPTVRGSLTFAASYHRSADFTQEVEYEGQAEGTSVTGSLLPNIQDVGFPTGEIDFFESPRAFIAYEGGAIEFFNGAFQNGDYPFEPAVFPGTQIRQIGEVNRDGSINEVAFGAAFEAAENVMVGGGANVIFGSYEFRQELIEIDQGGNDNYEVIRGNTVYTGLDQILYRDGYQDDIVGFNMRLGVSAKLADAIKFGVSFESPTWTSVDRTYTLAAVQTTFDQGGVLSYGMDNTFQSEGRGRIEYETRTPLRLSAGMEYDTDNLLLSADVEFVDWSQLDVDEATTGPAFGVASIQDAIDDNYSYVFNLRGGVEYRLEQGLALRGGLAYRPDPREGRAVANSTERDRLYVSGGLGYAVNDQFRIDVGWMQERMDDSFQPYNTTATGNLGNVQPPLDTAVYAPPTIQQDLVRNLFMLGMTFKF